MTWWDGVVCLTSNFALYSKGSSLLTFVMSSTTKLMGASNLSKTKMQISLWTIESEIDKNIQHTSSVGCDIVFFLQELAASSWYAFWAPLGSVPCPDLQGRGFAHHGGGANGLCVCHWQDCIHWPLCEGDLRWPTGTQIYKCTNVVCGLSAGSEALLKQIFLHFNLCTKLWFLLLSHLQEKHKQDVHSFIIFIGQFWNCSKFFVLIFNSFSSFARVASKIKIILTYILMGLLSSSPFNPTFF